ncbi:MAG: hypothetical protein J2P18_23460, partial [Nocardia sp.]|nr:hypothetical protein [Nocardia sp.]
MHVLFVCTGNVCRSVIAERVTWAIADAHGMRNLTAESAGTRALVGFGVDPLAAQTISSLGGDPYNFKARRLKPELIARADLILAMTERIRDDIADSEPGARARTFTLLEAHRIAKLTGARTVAEIDRGRNDLALVGRENIADPVGLSREQYGKVGDQIAETLEPLLMALHTQDRRQATETGMQQRPSESPAASPRPTTRTAVPPVPTPPTRPAQHPRPAPPSCPAPAARPTLPTRAYPAPPPTPLPRPAPVVRPAPVARPAPAPRPTPVA